MFTGLFRHRITIQKATKTQTYKGSEVVWADLETRWGRVVNLSPAERIQYQQIGMENITHKIVFKGDVTLELKDKRFVYNTNTYEMMTSKVDPDEVGHNTTIVVRRTPRS